MDIAIVGRHTKVSEDFQLKITDRIDKVESLCPGATRADVHVVHERNPRRAADKERVEITIHDHGVIRVEASAEDRVAALEMAMTRLTDRLRKMHDRKVKRHTQKTPLHAVPVADPDPIEDGPTIASVEPWEGAPETSHREVPIDGTPIVIRSKTHEGAPMTVADAIDQMELVGHDFYLFQDVDSGLPSAVYRRRGWTYGVIHLEATPAPATALDRDERARESA